MPIVESGVDLTLAELLTATGGVPRHVAGATRFVDVAVDSRRVAPGALFVALRGEQHDGHAFVARALAAGAAAALVERVPAELAQVAAPLVVVPDTYRALQDLGRARRARLDARVVGITGSVGKTTTKEVIAAVLAQRWRVLKSEGNLNTEVGLPLTLLRARPDHQALVLEMGMYVRGDIRLLAEIARPGVGVVTNVQPVHLERLGSIERIQQAKQELVEALGARDVAVLNRDDERVWAMAAATRARVWSYGLAADAEVRAETVVARGLDGVAFTLLHAGRRMPVRLPLPGAHSVPAALAASAVGLALGLELEEIVRGLERVSPQLRLAVRPGPRGSQVLDDSYNASPESMLAALNLLAELDGRKVAVLGDMLELGSEEEPGHRRVGRRAGEVADVLVTIGPRAVLFAEEARRAARPPAILYEAADRDAALTYLRGALQPGDRVLVKGSRGLQLEHLVANLRPDEEA